MTHATDFFIKEPADPETAWRIAREVLAEYSDLPVENWRYNSKPGKFEGQFGQGYVSILDMKYATDGPIPRVLYSYDTQTQEEREWIEDYWSFKFSFDTTYGYGDSERNLGCVSLHWALIHEIINRLADLYGREFTGVFDHEMIGEWFTIKSGEPQMVPSYT